MLKAIAIDDEPLALKVIERFAAKTPMLELVGSYQNPIEALARLQGEPVDLLFLDVQMPDITGIQLMQSLPDPPMVIFTTAHEKYAVESYELNALDYLLKPILFDRFLKAVNKAALQKSSESDATEESSANDALSEYMFLKSDTRIFKVKREDIQYVEGMRDYVAVHTSDGKRIMTLISLTKMLARLGAPDFVRVHKSFIVNVHHIHLIQQNRITIGEREIPISGTYRDDFYAMIGS
ncbi:MAG: LytR/AlgR family response regulator transcription factor [Bacteroidia bacterium]